MEYPEMKDRIAHIIRAKNLTAMEFAQRLGIQPSNVSHLLSGRNNPSLDFVKKLKETFPEYSLDWIVLGTGPMTLSEPFVLTNSDTPTPSYDLSSVAEEEVIEPSLFAIQNNPVESPIEKNSLKSIEVKQIIVVYSNNSFEILSPK